MLWLFPIAFIFHDFEEIMFWELWLNKHGGEIKSRVPAFLAKQVGTIVEKLTAIKTLEDLRRYYPLPTEYDYEQTAEESMW